MQVNVEKSIIMETLDSTHTSASIIGYVVYYPETDTRTAYSTKSVIARVRTFGSDNMELVCTVDADGKQVQHLRAKEGAHDPHTYSNKVRLYEIINLDNLTIEPVLAAMLPTISPGTNRIGLDLGQLASRTSADFVQQFAYLFDDDFDLISAETWETSYSIVVFIINPRTAWQFVYDKPTRSIFSVSQFDRHAAAKALSIWEREKTYG